jgi:hypothetical protein
MQYRGDGIDASAQGEVAVEALARLTTVRLIEQEKTKRLLIASVTLLFVVAAAAMLFAPDGREALGGIIGAALLVMALGAIGASRFLLRVGGVEIDTMERRAADATAAQRGGSGGSGSVGGEPMSRPPEREAHAGPQHAA